MLMYGAMFVGGLALEGETKGRERKSSAKWINQKKFFSSSKIVLKNIMDHCSCRHHYKIIE